MFFRNQVRIRRGIRGHSEEIRVKGKRIAYHLKKIYIWMEHAELSARECRKLVCMVSNPMVKTSIPAGTIYSLNVLSALYEIREPYTAELLEHYRLSETGPGSLLLVRKQKNA